MMMMVTMTNITTATVTITNAIKTTAIIIINLKFVLLEDQHNGIN